MRPSEKFLSKSAQSKLTQIFTSTIRWRFIEDLT
jgi:hypothetical protein